jgi:hypothetical protein
MIPAPVAVVRGIRNAAGLEGQSDTELIGVGNRYLFLVDRILIHSCKSAGRERECAVPIGLPASTTK